MTLTFFLLSLSLQAQSEWKWPEDTGKAQENWVLFTDALSSQRYSDAIIPFQWLLSTAPQLHPSLYIQGEKLYKGLIDNTREPDQKRKYQQQVLALYDTRMQYFGQKSAVMNRKVLAAYQYYRSQPEQYTALFHVFDEAAQAGLRHFNRAVLVAYMDVIRLYQAEGAPLPEEEILHRYDQITQALQDSTTTADVEDTEKKQEIIDELLAATISLDCPLIEEKFGRPFLKQPTDLTKAKRVVALSLAYGCRELPVFLEAAQVVQQQTPTFGLAKLIALISDAQHQTDTAELYFHQAVHLAKHTVQQADVLYMLAVHYHRENEREKARTTALKAIQADPSRKEAYKLIGDLYLSSFSDCKGGISKTRDRALYIAAYEMYQKAGRTDLMQQVRQQFPSIEEMFQENFKKGQTIRVGCWIQEDVMLDSRAETP